jgi:alanine racemase
MRQTYARVNLRNFLANLSAIRTLVQSDVKIMAVVKADAYGHGLVQIAQAAQQGGADWLGVALAEEGIALRKAGIQLPILVLVGLLGEGAAAAAQYGLTLTIHTPEQLEAAALAAKGTGVPVEAHLKLDTGMNRIGIKEFRDLRAVLRAFEEQSQVRLTGAYTHFACADSSPDFTDGQLTHFMEMAQYLPHHLLLHACGSSAILTRPDAHFDMVRAGISLYGYAPVPTEVPLKPVLSWMAEINYVKSVPEGESIGYGATYTAPKPMRIATLSVGYGDGYSRLLSNRGRVLINGCSCPIVGRTCMDMTMVAITDAGSVKAGDEAVLIGAQGEETITASELATLMGTIPYEVLLNISRRVPRIYQ